MVRALSSAEERSLHTETASSTGRLRPEHATASNQTVNRDTAAAAEAAGAAPCANFVPKLPAVSRRRILGLLAGTAIAHADADLRTILITLGTALGLALAIAGAMTAAYVMRPSCDDALQLAIASWHQAGCEQRR